MSEAVRPAPGEIAGFGRRIIAIVIDWVAAIGVSLLVFRDVAYGSLESSAAILALFALEVIVLTWLIGASFGQRLLGLAVVRTDGSRLSLGRVALRTLLLCLVIPAVVVDSFGRGLHDRAVDSVVIRAR
ncbi:MAG: RDD family protein [Actinomycetales bacterium]|nr:RDD family protein [Actinomycetales bacterium]